MRWFCTGDWQIESKPSFDKIDKDGASIRFAENNEFIAGLMDHAKKSHGCEGMLHAGDLLEHKNGSALELAAVARLFTHWGKDYPVRISAGNHEFHILEQSGSSLEVFQILLESDNFRVFHSVDAEYIGDADFVFLPYLFGKTPEEIKEEIRPFIPGKRDNAFMLAHYGCALSKMGANNRVLAGDHLNADTLWADRFKAIIAGHIHGGQTVMLGDTPFIHPSSPVIQDFGERLDRKGYVVLDTTKGTYEFIDMPPPRKWVQVSWKDFDTSKPLWGAGDIVKIVGEYNEGDAPQVKINTAINSGALPEPWDLKFDATLHSDEQSERGEEVAKAGSLMDSVKLLADKLFPGVDVSKALALVDNYVRAGRKPLLGKKITPVSLEVTDWQTWPHALLENMSCGIPTLVYGPNGLGKTNLLGEAPMFALCGDTSKGVDLDTLVAQGASKAIVKSVYDFDNKGTITITRTALRSKTGQGSQKLHVQVSTMDEPLAGSVKEIQRQLEEMMGFTYASLKATNFLLQADREPWALAKPAVRKTVLSEIIGLSSLNKAYDQIKDLRKDLQKALSLSEAAYNSLLSVKPAKSLEDLQKELDEVKKGIEPILEAEKNQNSALSSLKLGRQDILTLITSLETEIRGLRNVDSDIESKKSQVETLTKNHTANREKALAEYKKVKAEITGMAIPPLAPNRQAVVDGMVKQKDALQEKLKTALQEKLISVKDKHKTANEDYSLARTTKAVASAERLADVKLLGGFKIGVGVCPECLQNVSGEHLETQKRLLTDKVNNAKAKEEAMAKVETEAQQKVTQLSAEIASVEAEIKMAESEVKELDKKLQDMEKELTDRKIKEEKLKSLNALLEEKTASGAKANEDYAQALAVLTDEIKALEGIAAGVNKEREEKTRHLEGVKWELTGKNSEISTAEDALNALVNRRNSAQVSEKTLQAEIERATAFFAEVEKKEKTYSADKEALTPVEHALALLNPTSGLPIFLIDLHLPFLSARANHYLEELKLEIYLGGFH